MSVDAYDMSFLAWEHFCLRLVPAMSCFSSPHLLLLFSLGCMRTEELVTDVPKVASVWHGILCARKTTVATLVPGEERVVKVGLLSDEMRRIGFLVVFGGCSLLFSNHNAIHHKMTAG